MPTVSELREQFEPKKTKAPVLRRSTVNVCSMMRNQSETRCNQDLCQWDGKQCAPKEYFSSKPYWQVLEEQRQKRLDNIENELKSESNPHKQNDLERERARLEQRSYQPERPWYQFWGGMLPFVKRHLRQLPRSSDNLAGRRAYNYLKLHGGASFPTSNVGAQQEYLDRIREIYGALNASIDENQAYRGGLELIVMAMQSNRLQELDLNVVALQAKANWPQAKDRLKAWVENNMTPTTGEIVVLHAIDAAKSTWKGMCEDHLLENDPFVMEDVEDVMEPASDENAVEAAVTAGKEAIENGRLDQLQGVADATNQWDAKIKTKLIQHAQTALRAKKTALITEKDALENQENIDPNRMAALEAQLDQLPSPNQAIMALMRTRSTNARKSESTWQPDRSDYVTFFVPEAENPFYCIPRKTLVRQSQELNRYLLEPFSGNYEKKMTDDNLQLGCIMGFYAYETNDKGEMDDGPIPDMSRPYKVLEIDHNRGTHKKTGNDYRIRAVHEEKDEDGNVKSRLVLWDNDQNDIVRYHKDDLDGSYVMYEENQPLFTSYIFKKRSYLTNARSVDYIGGEVYSHLFIGDAHCTQVSTSKWKIPSVDMYEVKEETQKAVIEIIRGSTSNKMVWPTGSENQQTELTMSEEVEAQYKIRAGDYVHWGPITGGELREIVEVNGDTITIEGHEDLENEELRFCRDKVLPKTVVLATSEECTMTIRGTTYTIADAKQFKLADVSAYYPKVQGKDNLKAYVQELIRTNNAAYKEEVHEMIREESINAEVEEVVNASVINIKEVKSWFGYQAKFRPGMVIELFEDDLRYVTITNVQPLGDAFERRYQLTASEPVFTEGMEEVYAYDLEAILTDPVEFWGVVYKMAQQDNLDVQMNFLPCTIDQEYFLDTFVMDAKMRRKCKTNVAHYLTLDLSGRKVTLDYLHVRKMLDTPDTNAYVITPRVRNKQYYVSNPLWTQTALNGGSLVSARHGEPGDESPIYELRDVESGTIVANYPSTTSHHLNPVLVDPSVVLHVDKIAKEIGTVSVLQKEVKVVPIRGTLSTLDDLDGTMHSVIYLENSVAIPKFVKEGDFIQWNGSSKHPVIELTSNTFTIKGEFPELDNWVTILFANPKVVRKQVNMIERASAAQWEARDWQTVKRMVNLFGVHLTVPDNLKGEAVYDTYKSEDNKRFTRNMAAFNPLQTNAFVNQYGELLEDLMIDGKYSSGVIYGNKMIKDANYYNRAVQSVQDIYREMDEFTRCEPQEDVMCLGADTIRKNLLQTLEFMFPFPEYIEQFDTYDKALFIYLICYTSTQSQAIYRDLVNLKGADIEDEGIDTFLVMRFESDKNKYLEDEADVDWQNQKEYVNEWFNDRQHLFVNMREVLPLEKQWEWLQRQSMPSSPSSPPQIRRSNWADIGNTPGTSPLRASQSPIRRMPSFELEESAQGEEGRQGSIFSLDDDDSSDDSSQGLSMFGL